MKSLFVAAIAIVLTLVSGCSSAADRLKERNLSVQLGFKGGGVCSGTPVSRNTILTAAHCVDDKPRSMTVDGVPTGIREIIDDGNDHALVVTYSGFTKRASFGPHPTVGDHLHIFGNPAAIEDSYREGTYSAPLTAEGTRWYTIDMNVWHGDSGAAVWNEDGQIVLMITAYYIEVNPFTGASFKLALALPFDFTDAEWKRAGVTSPQPRETPLR